MSIAPRHNILLLLLCLLLLSLSPSSVTVAAAAATQQKAKKADDCLYQILGVSRSASTQEIKRAYRRKALDTHPDKNTNVPADEAAETFRQVVEAFEVLSDEASRKYYDRTGRTNTQGSSSSGTTGGQRRSQASHTVRFSWNFQRRTVRLKDRFDVQKAQSRVLHVVSLDQLKTIMLDDNDLLERNLLLCFVTAGKIQQIAEDAEKFRQVVEAFEVLSDDASRKHYDRKGRSGHRRSSASHTVRYSWSFQQRRQPVRLKDRFEAQKAQSRVLHVVSLEQLKTIMLN